MTPEDLERFEAALELALYKEYRDVVGQFDWVVETERRFYLCNAVDVTPHEGWFEVALTDAWTWDMYRPARFVKSVRVLTFKDVNIERLDKPDLELPTT